MRSPLPRLAASLLLAASTGLMPLAAQADPSVTGAVSVSGTHLLLDGHPWIPHGVYQIAFEAPPAYDGGKPFWKVASRFYRPVEYTNIRRFGADSVRIQVAQPGMDPQNSLSTRQYRDDVIAAIHAARQAGLIVIVSVQDEKQTGEQHETPLPNDATQRVWDILAPAYGQDRGVLFELFNEPLPQPSPANWQAWADAMNATIATVRNAGAQNVVIADGLGVGQRLGGAPLLSDRLGQVAYSSHPYATKALGNRQHAQTAAAWDAKFGDFSRRAPVIITEWGTGYFCNDQTPHAVLNFLSYLQQHGIGLEAGTWDWQSAGFGSVRYGFPHPRTSTLAGPDGPLPCSTPGFGPGRVVQDWYRTGVPPSNLE